MKVCATYARKSRKRRTRKRRIFIVCDWLVNSMPLVLSLFFSMFCFVLFCVWYFPEFSWWLVGLNIALIACMTAVAVMFAIGSREMA